MTTEPRANPLGLFHPLVGEWFRECVGEPTEVQALAWPAIADDGHVLVTAPTGSGKTLTAFLWSLNQLLTGTWSSGRLRVLYVSPLKALNNDIRRNLTGPLAALERRFEERGEEAVPIRVQTRSGDTTGSERQRMLRQPPEILITTPESLNILLTSVGGRTILGGIRCVILDEIHAVAGSKRGTHLITAVDRLVPLAGEFQRVALSATIRPAEKVARFVGGFKLAGTGETVGYRPRQVEVIRSRVTKAYDLEVRVAEGTVIPDTFGRFDADHGEPRGVPGTATETATGIGRSKPHSSNPWDAIAAEFKLRIGANRSTLLFANSRRTAEKVTRLLNDGEPAELAYSHHGSLSRELRTVVERRLKEGRLSAIVSTNSLELGIDIGSLDEVILIQTPPTLASAVQRLGRAGHGVGETSRGRLYPLFGRDLVEAAVVAAGVLEHDIEAVEPITGALDVLAQVLLSMTAAESWDIDELYDFVRTSYPYRELKRRQFDLVLEMLAGRYADSRIRELYPRISLDRIDNTVRARRGSARLVYLSGGTIPDRGYFALRHQESMAKLGELDEEFVWERSLGDTFTLGAQSWRVARITHNDVMVVPAHKGAAMAPFWRAEARNRGFFLSDRIARFLERADAFLSERRREDLGEILSREHCLEPVAVAQLLELLERQRAATEGALPHRHHLLIEHLAEEGMSQEGHRRAIFHTLWGGEVNRPLAMALKVAWERKHRTPLQIDSENDCLMVALPADFDAPDLLELVRADNVEELLRAELEKTGFFGARFRENAGRALLLPRSGFRSRIPLWLNRQRAKKLLESVSRYEDFPILFETWRTCLQDEFDLEGLKQVLGELAREEIRISECRTSAPSPFAANLIWKETNRLMYEGDTPEGGASALRGDLLRELVFSSSLRPEIPAALRDELERKLHRTYPGYAPRTSVELLDWVRERLLLREDEWRELLAAVEVVLEGGEGGETADELVAALERKLVRVSDFRSGRTWVCALEVLPRWIMAGTFDLEFFEMTTVTEDQAPVSVADLEEAGSRLSPEEIDGDPFTDLAAEFLRSYGPVSRDFLIETLNRDAETIDRVLSSLVEEERVVVDRFGGPDSPDEICDAENLERLLRLLRASARPHFEALPLSHLPLHLANQQGLGTTGAGLAELQQALEGLLLFSAPAGRWEADLLPARLDPYYPSWLDSLFQESDLIWVGTGKENLTFLFPSDLDLLDAGEQEATSTLLPDRPGRHGFGELLEGSNLDTGELTEKLWAEAWTGAISNTSYAAVRTGALNRFRATETAPQAAPNSRSRSRTPGRRFERWRASRPFSGDWFRIAGDREDSEPLDALDFEELNKDRARVLLDRYGVLFREILMRESPALRWGSVFRSLRIMELSGEVLSGQFFEGIPGLQFASPAAYRRLRKGLAADRIYWMSAIDPASPCGLSLEAWSGALPRRVPSNHLVFHGAECVLVSQRNASELDIRVDADHPHLIDYIGFMKVLLTRQFQPLKLIQLEIINGEPAPESPYAQTLASAFSSTRDHRSLKLRRRY